MNKEQFKLQTYNNRYMRGVVVAICKIIIWTLVYILIMSVAMSVITTDFAAVAKDGYYSYSSPSIGAGTIFALLVVFVVTVVYYWAVIAEIVRKIKENRQLTAYEEEALGDDKPSSKEK